MKYKPNDVVMWDAGNGILHNGKEYLVDMVRDGERVQEFTLKHLNGWKLEDSPVPVWWEVGAPFIRRQKAVTE
jgi:hypothetical protein